MIGVGNIKVEGKGKTPEQIKEEIMSKVAEQIDSMLEINKEEVKEEPKGPSYITIEAKEDEGKTGFGIHVNFDGDFGDVMTMLTVGVSEALHNISDDEDDEYNPELLLDFITALTAEYRNGVFGKKAEEEKEDGKE